MSGAVQPPMFPGGWTRWETREWRIETRPKGRKRFRVVKRIFEAGQYRWSQDRYFKTREKAEAGMTAWIEHNMATAWRGLRGES